MLVTWSRLLFLARDVYHISCLCYDVSVRLSVCPSVCDGSALWSRCMPGRGEGSSRAMLATAWPSCTIVDGTAKTALIRTIIVSLLFARTGDTAMPGGLHARLCHAFLVKKFFHREIPDKTLSV